MKYALEHIIRYVTHIGIENVEPERKRTIKLNNLIWLYYSFVIAISFIVSLFLDVPYVQWVTLSFLLVYLSIIGFSFAGHHNFFKQANVIVLVVMICLLSLLYGSDSKLIYFLIPVFIQLFLIFEFKDVRYLVINSIVITLIFLGYFYFETSLQHYSIFKEYGRIISYVTLPYLFILLFLLMFFIFRSNYMILDKNMRQRNFYQYILNNIPIEIVVMDKDFKYLFVNKRAIKDDSVREWIIGKTDFDYVKQRNKDIQIAIDRNKLYKKVEQLKSAVTEEEVFFTNEGKKVYTQRTLSYVDYSLGKEMQYIGYSLDITQKKESDELLKQYMIKLEKSNEEIKQFAYITSHDLKSPLRNINSLLQLFRLKNESNIAENSIDLLDTSIKSAQHLYNLVSDILLYTTSEIDKSLYSNVCLNSVVQEVMKNLNSYIAERNAIVEIPEHLPQIFSHKSMMYNLFSNLIQNGIKYNKSIQPKVTVTYSESELFYHFTITDNGIGIDPKYYKQIFVMLKRLHNQEEYEGTGIGLSICKQIVENLGGQIHVDSKTAMGTSFYFTLPKEK